MTFSITIHMLMMTVAATVPFSAPAEKLTVAIINTPDDSALSSVVSVPFILLLFVHCCCHNHVTGTFYAFAGSKPEGLATRIPSPQFPAVEMLLFYTQALPSKGLLWDLKRQT